MKTFYNLKTFTFTCSRMSTLLSQHQNRKVLFVIVQTSHRAKALSMCTCACVCATIGCRLICAFYIGCVKTSMKILELGEYEWKINQFQSKNAKVDIEKIDYHMHTDIVKWFEYKTIKTKLLTAWRTIFKYISSLMF